MGCNESGNNLRARSAIDTAPAVCELDGPIMLGPITSKILIKFMRSLLKLSVETVGNAISMSIIWDNIGISKGDGELYKKVE